jgi:hypothetical protein
MWLNASPGSAIRLNYLTRRSPRGARRRRGVPWRRKCPPPRNFLHRRRRACLLSRGFSLLMPAARPKPDRRPDGLPPRAGVTGLSPLASTAPSFLNNCFSVFLNHIDVLLYPVPPVQLYWATSKHARVRVIFTISLVLLQPISQHGPTLQTT